MITIENISTLIEKSKYDFPDGWFFPSDLIPHSAKLKYACKKLTEKGLMEKRGDSSDRWGYAYRIIQKNTK